MLYLQCDVCHVACTSRSLLGVAAVPHSLFQYAVASNRFRMFADEKSSTPRSARVVNPKSGRRTGARGQGELNEHEGRESRERAASLHGEEVVTRESSTGDEVTEERRIVVADTTVDYASNVPPRVFEDASTHLCCLDQVKELQYLHKCIEQTIQNCNHLLLLTFVSTE